MVVLLVILAMVVIIILSMYNKIIKLKNNVKRSKSTIDIYLNQRFDLIPNLVECVKSYKEYEKDVFESITKLRSEYQKDKSLTKAGELNAKVNDIMATVEAYPDIKANEQYLNLQNKLDKLESQLQAARRIYNNDVNEYNIKIQTVPNNVIANIFRFKEEKLFELEESKRENIKVELSNI